MKPPEFHDHTDGGCPPVLLAKAMNTLEGSIMEVWPVQQDWFPKRLFMVNTHRGESGIFMEKEGGYVHVNSGAELTAINEILREYRFARRDFANAQKVHAFLGKVTFFHRGPGLVPASSFALRTMGNLSYWTRGTEKSEAVIKELCRDPYFAFDGDKWAVTFNAFRPDGGVDEWRLVGQHDSKTESNEILRINVSEVKPEGTFSYAFMGG